MSPPSRDLRPITQSGRSSNEDAEADFSQASSWEAVVKGGGGGGERAVHEAQNLMLGAYRTLGDADAIYGCGSALIKDHSSRYS